MLVVIDRLSEVVVFAAVLTGFAARALAQEPAAGAAQPSGTTEVAAEPPAVEVPAPPAAIAAPVASAPTSEAKAPEEPARSWFWRPPLRAEFGKGWGVTLYGFVEADFIFDTTRSYDDAIGPSLVAHSDTYAGQTGRSQFSVRNSRLGLMFQSPILAGVKASAVLESDFFGNQQHDASEHAFFDSPDFRLRHAYLQIQTDYVDLVAGQTYTVFGFQNYFFPCSLEFLGLPNQLFSRSTQLRVAHDFDLAGDFGLDVALAAVRPGQRDASVPDAQVGARFSVKRWKGITTPGNFGTQALPLSIALSATLRQFKVNAFTPPPTQRSNSGTGWGFAVDALVPIIPASHADDRGNRLTLTGSFVTGTAIADLITAGGGASFPTLPNPAQMNPPPQYTPDIDDGLVSFDARGVLQTIDWWAVRTGLQYYLPPSGRLILSANYTQAHSGNLAKLFPKGGAEIELLTNIADRSHYADFNVLWDATPAIRIGLSGQYTKVDYLDGDSPDNLRAMAQALYAF